jgi:Trk K+ transport system NAD-binding subunit
MFNIEDCADALAVIAGFGDVGTGAYQGLQASGISCMVVDSKPQGMNQVIGNAEDEGVLKKARIEEARFCIVALNDDDVNIFTTLMARNLNPVIRILSRANDPASVEKLYRAGADYVALLPAIGGQTIARIVLEEYVTILLDLPDGEVVVIKRVAKARPGSVGNYFRRTGVRIIGIESPGRSIVAPSADEVLINGDDVVAVGTTEQLKKFIHQI